MCLRVLVEIFGNAIGLILLGFFGFIVLFYGLGLVISIGIGIIIWVVLLILNPLTWIFGIILVLGTILILSK